MWVACSRLRIDGATQARSDLRKTLVGGPQGGISGQFRRREKLRIDVPDSQPVELITVDKHHDLLICRDSRLRNASKQADDLMVLR